MEWKDSALRADLRPASVEEQQPHDLGHAGRLAAGFELDGESLDDLQRAVALGRADELEAPAANGLRHGRG